MTITPDQKREIARCFNDNAAINEKDDCVTLYAFKGICNIQFKYNENKGAFPGLAIWAYRRRQDFILKFQTVTNYGFKYNQSQIIKNEDYGWVAFYREGCETQQRAYEQIVDPGDEKDKWKSFYDYLKSELSQFVKQIPEDSTHISQEPSISQLGNEQNSVGDNNMNHPRNWIFFGAPGTGKSFTVDKTVANDDTAIRTTFHPDSDYASFVGAYKPTMNGDKIAYEFVPQAFTKAYVQAWEKMATNPQSPERQYLVIEEINRGNCAQIFGDLFQLLDRADNGYSKYPINPDTDLATGRHNPPLR